LQLCLFLAKGFQYLSQAATCFYQSNHWNV